MAQTADQSALFETPLAERHRALGARMVPFAGYAMPVQYEGIIAEHVWTRTHAGLFDVSHMGQVFVVASEGTHEAAAAALEALIPGDIQALQPGRMRYSFLTNDGGGILDDLMVTRSTDEIDDGRLMLVINAACKQADIAHLKANLPDTVKLDVRDDRALLALQGPDAEAALAIHAPKAAGLPFMSAIATVFDGIDCHISRSGYTGEDGFEISVAADDATAIWDALVRDDRVKPIGLGARDSLRLEAGLCLYGHDLDETTSPVEAGLIWAISKRRRAEGGFPGAGRVQSEIADGPARKRVGIRPEGRAPAREGTRILADDGTEIGTVTSGGYGPSVEAPVAMGYVSSDRAEPGTRLLLDVRGRHLPATVVPMPFVPHRFKR
ncbi:glycine cleavage system aminomethyltransferase GcvT [Amorphus orientalis]|uniref:aminomethyltransferase n=1 Tax=Amorphus orientalis TaxID=649198 RepID=A0AAE3VNZ9_9HYPH|nr:glycine cleavage system aminomethyltransferase GcvT [Amorphus orientalis]MDQ0316149.1 aminomethyltransferase [Amorphus orientalis]